MRSDRVERCLLDIVNAAELIANWVCEAGGADRAMADVKTRSAIERKLLVISEAAIRLHHIDAELAPRLAANVDWPGVRGMGNFIRHKYDDLDFEIVADVLRTKLDTFKDAAATALRQIRAEKP